MPVVKENDLLTVIDVLQQSRHLILVLLEGDLLTQIQVDAIRGDERSVKNLAALANRIDGVLKRVECRE